MRNRYYCLIIFMMLSCLKIKAQSNIDSTSIYITQKKYHKALKYVSNMGNYFVLNNIGINLYQSKEYNNSLLFFLETLKIGKEKLNKKELKNLLNDLGHNYQNINDYNNAIKYFELVYTLNVEIYGELEYSNISALYNLIAVNDLMKDYYKTAELYLKILEIQEKLLGNIHPGYVNTIYNLAWVYSDQSRFDLAEDYFIRALEIDGKIKSIDNIDYAESLNHLYVFYGFYKLDYEKAQYYLNQIIKIKKRVLGEDNEDYVKSYEMLGFLYENKKEYDSALKIFNTVLEKSSGNKNKSFIITYESIIRINCIINNGNESVYVEDICNKFLQEVERILGKKSQHYLNGLMYLASFYENNDVLHLAKKRYEEIIDIKKNVLNEDINSIYPSYSSLANVYKKMGNFDLAERLNKFIVQKNIENNVSKDKQATSYNDLASVYMDKYKYDLALINYLLAIELIEKENNEERFDYATYLSNLGLLYIKIDKFKEAEFYLLKSLKIKEKLIGLFHDSYLTTCSNLAALYQRTNRFKEAEKYYLIAINNSLNKNSFGFKNRLLNLSTLYGSLNDVDNEKKFLKKYSQYFQNDITAIIYNYSLSEQQMMLNNISNSKNYPLNFLNRNSNQNEIAQLALDEDLLLKNLTINNHQRITKIIISSSNTELKAKHSKFINNKKQLSKLDELPESKRPLNYDVLILETENLEKYLVEQSNEFSELKKTLSVKWGKLQAELNPNEIIINFVDFVYHDAGKELDRILYAAFVIGKDYEFPKFISLFEEKHLQKLIAKTEALNDNSRINKQYTDKAISNLFLKPLENELQGTSTIYLSPSGLAHQLAFSALPISENQTFGEKYNLHILSSPAEIMDYKVAGLDKKSNLELLLYGGIDYNKTNSLRKSGTDIVANNEILNELQTRSGISEFGYLPGSKKEVTAIQLKATKNGFRTTLLDDGVATEESVKQLDGRTSPFILHLATHGFFFPDPKQELSKDFSLEEVTSKIYKVSEEPMMRSGLLFAGANKYWGKPNENLTEENGILTASEISNLDLSACQLVVLSACETGLGQVKGSEGVFGLQRAFKMAGVKNIIMSLWKVPDAQTAELFEIFYGECFAGKSIHEAFQTAQTKMKVNYSPYYWGGFVLLE